MRKQWFLKQLPPRSPGMGAGSGLHPLVADILAVRGMNDPDEVRRFLTPALADMHDPTVMKGVGEAVERLLVARRRGETVCVYGDYDVDGITGTTLLVSFLRAAGFDCHYFIPNRFDDGYGLTVEALEQIMARGGGLIVSVDCGITAVNEARFCRERGVDLIIVDHHAPKEEIPAACAVINPLQPGCAYPFKGLAGVGVAFNLLVALRSALRRGGAFAAAGAPDLRRWLDLVALGTIADVVPLVGQNRIYTSHGLRLMSDPARLGLRELKRVAGVNGQVTSGQVGFRLAPRLNAAGRMESAVPGVDLLLSRDPVEARRVAEELDAANAERQSVERAILDEAVGRVESNGLAHRRSIVLASRSWHQGVIGIVASRLAERFHRPTIMISIDESGRGRGSGRGIPGFHLLEALTGCAPFLERFGGHRYAAGMEIGEERVEEFARAFEAEACRRLGEEELVPRLDLDLEVRPEDVTPDLARELKRLEPFGMGNPEPLLFMGGMRVAERRVVGEGHLRLRLARDGRMLDAIAFRMAAQPLAEMIDIAFFPEMNEWNGNSNLQLKVKDFRAAE